MKKFNQVLGDDEKLRSQLELLISPTCSCKQADVCVVRKFEFSLGVGEVNFHFYILLGEQQSIQNLDLRLNKDRKMAQYSNKGCL